MSATLTPRERQVLGFLVDGLTTEEIASELGVVLETARNHIRHILLKLDAHSRVQAVARARKLGLLEPSPLTEGDALAAVERAAQLCEQAGDVLCGAFSWEAGETPDHRWWGAREVRQTAAHLRANLRIMKQPRREAAA